MALWLIASFDVTWEIEKKKHWLDPLNWSFVSKEDLWAHWMKCSPSKVAHLRTCLWHTYNILRQQKWFADMWAVESSSHARSGHVCSGVGHTLEKSVNSPGVSQGVSYWKMYAKNAKDGWMWKMYLGAVFSFLKDGWARGLAGSRFYFYFFLQGGGYSVGF